MIQTPKPFARLSSEQWQHIINEQLESGMSQKDFCLSQNISIATFSSWKRKLRDDNESTSISDAKSQHDWIEIPANFPQPETPSACHMELELPGGVILRIRQ